jgi:4-hydroxythreonine-4-phosphate dehydrogenase
MGDPAGIGGEVIAKALAHPEIYEVCRPLVLGDVELMERSAQIVPGAPRIRPVRSSTEGRYRHGKIDLLQIQGAPFEGVEFGKLSPAAGKVGVEAVKQAVQLAQKQEIDAIVTAPLNKEAIALAGYAYPGHTEILAELTGCRAGMLLVTQQLRVVHVSTHVSLRAAIELISTERVLQTIDLAKRAAVDLGIADPRIAVAGLNPHAGEGGRFGREEIESIEPAIRAAQQAGTRAYGPISPDTLFWRASRGEFDIVVAMYHDQGHIPIKLQGFDDGINVTVGLPIIRTSVDHGTAFDIAGRGIARESSMLAALRVALQLVAARRSRQGAD